MSVVVILLSILLGSSFILGFLISSSLKDKVMQKFSLSLSFVTILGVVFTKLMPRFFNISHNYNEVWTAIIGEILGIVILFAIDMLIPRNNKKDNKYIHTGLVMLIPVVLYSILSGIYFKVDFSSSYKLGMDQVFDLFILNIPLGVALTYFLEGYTEKYIRKNLTLFVSPILGTLIGLLIGSVSPVASIAMLSILSGMLLYVSIFKLGIELFKNMKERGIVEGILVGAIIAAIVLL